MSAKRVEQEVSVGLIRDLLIEFMSKSHFVNDNEEIVDFKFGKTLPTTKLNTYMNMLIPVSYTVQKKTEVKIYNFGKKE